MKDKFELKKWIILILVTAAALLIINNIKTLASFLMIIIECFLPFILGGVIAFIINIPMRKVEQLLKKKMKNLKLIRIIAIILSLLFFILIFSAISLMLIPELVENIKTIVDIIPGLVDKFEVFMVDILDKYPNMQTQIKDLFARTGNMTDTISNVLNYCINRAVDFVGSIVSGFVTIFTSIIFAFYLLFQKEYIIRCSKKVIYAIFDKKKASKILEIGSLTNKTFSKFISGQCVEAVILGILMFTALSIAGFYSYALIIAVLTAITALIPIFGAIIAMIIGAILIALTNPMQVLVFVAIFLIVQQIEGNFIYPKVVGKSVGLSPLWTLLAITVGGNLFGVIGMLIGLPLASVIYAILKGIINNKLEEKEINII